MECDAPRCPRSSGPQWYLLGPHLGDPTANLDLDEHEGQWLLSSRLEVQQVQHRPWNLRMPSRQLEP